ncbi:MAG: diguanylate cyclase domain-containing protein [Gemmatimonadota bacterium]
MTITATESPRSRGAYSRVLNAGVLGGYALMVLLGLVFWQVGPTRALLSGSVLFAASLLATVICFGTWWTLAAPANRVWLLLGIGGLLASLSHIAQLLPADLGRISGVHFLWLGSYVCLAAGVIVEVHNRERGRITELALDIALIVTAASLLVVRLAPGTRAALAGQSDVLVFLIIFAPVLALSAILPVAVLVTDVARRDDDAVSRSIAAAIGCLAISTLPQVLSGGSCCHSGALTTLAAIGVWVFVALAGSHAWLAGDPKLPLAGSTRLRQFVAPTVALVLAGISMHGALGVPFGRNSALALGVLGALVALRLTELLNATRLQVTERRELTQARALVEVSRALAGKNDLDTTLRIVTQWAVRVLNARAASVEMLSSDAKTLVLRAAEGLPEDAIGLTFAVDNSFTGWVIINGDARVTTNPARDPFITADSLKYLGNSPVAAMPLRYRERLLGVLTCIGNRPFDAADLDLLRAFANQTALALEDARLFDQVRALSVTDPLTGLANRRQLDRELTREFAAAQRGRRLVAVMFDLDDFKQHNDKYGHMAGDDALRHFADALRTTTRTMNLAARYGGDEFFALLADSDQRGAEVFINRVKERFRRTMDAAGWPVLRVSAGMAEYTPEMKTPEDLIGAADRALYVAKFEADVSA